MAKRGRGGHRGNIRGGNGHADRQDVRNNDGEMNSQIPERFRGRPRDSPRSTSFSDAAPDVKLNLHIRAYFREAQMIADSNHLGWLGLPELPSSDEVMARDESDIELVPNKMRGRWKSKEKYLRAHYELSREDAISPLRDAVEAFRRTPDMGDDGKLLCVYEKVYVAGFTFAHLGIAARIRFSTARAGRGIQWRSSKRLVSGSIVALTPADDKFRKKCIIAVVAARPLAGVEASPPEIDIYFSNPQDIVVDPQKEFIMIEAKQGYFEASRYTMAALQKLSGESFPLSESICRLVTELQPPEYLKNRPLVSLAAAFDNVGPSNRTFNVLEEWPAHPGDSTLDGTQWDALNQMMTKELAIIQGPPGTGKTHISKIGLQIMVEQKLPEDPPIIVAAQTNHALDQLLSHVALFEPEFIRLGGRSTNLKIKQRALYEIRQRERMPPVPGGMLGKATAMMRSHSSHMIETLEPLARTGVAPLSVKNFLDYGIISEQQAQSLNKAASSWVTSDDMPENPMELWLNKSLLPFEVFYQPDNFGFDEAEEDLEFEQLQELEAENGVADEEDIENLRGGWVSVNDRFTVATPSGQILDNAEKKLDTTSDLWKIPDYLRGPVYLIMQRKLKHAIAVKFRDEAEVYQKLVQDLKIGKWERDAVYLERANIIGMTTTGLSKYRPLISSLKPKIVLIEEAAEVIEGPVTVACMDSLEHLILVGDHEQLQGHCNVRDLEGAPYYLNVSMFERLVTNQMPFKTLLRQRRMDPEFRRLLQPIYPKLEDHPVVLSRPSLEVGMGDVKSFFFDHEFSEFKDSQLSTYNDKEAEFVAGFYLYLLKNGADPRGITILTFYNGQRKRILKYLRDEPLVAQFYNNVKTVDSYQGEENLIVILSLVRSNDYGQIGFLDIENRVCVALSRAKQGFYLFGNSKLLANSSTLWGQVIGILQTTPNRVGTRLPITCKQHNQRSFVTYPEEWKSNDGGCGQPCGQVLPCDHLCTFKCHSYGHETVKCFRKCEKTLSCGHTCCSLCYETCRCDCPKSSQEKDRGDTGEDLAAKSDPQANFVAPGGSNNPWSRDVDIRYTEVRDNNRPENHHNRFAKGKQQELSHLPHGYDPAAALSRAVDRSPTDAIDSTHNSRPSTSSGRSVVWNTMHSSQSSGYGFPPRSHQPSPEREDAGIGSWNGFANGGAKRDDDRRQHIALMEAETAVRANGKTLLIEFDDETVVEDEPPRTTVTKEEVTELAGGRRKFTEEFMPHQGVGKARVTVTTMKAMGLLAANLMDMDIEED